MDDYWALTVVHVQLAGSPWRSLRLTSFRETEGTREIVEMRSPTLFDDRQAQQFLWTQNAALLSRLNVQLGLELGLLS